MWKAIFLIAAISAFSGCTQQQQSATEIKHFDITSLNDIIDQRMAEMDQGISSDGNGSVRIQFKENSSIQLFNIENPSLDDCKLIYRARLKANNLNGRAYLEMLCFFKGQGEFFSRGLNSPLKGTTDWTTEETYFFLQRGQRPDRIKLNLVVEGKGTVWVDDISLLRVDT